MCDDPRTRAEDIPIGRAIDLGQHHVTQREMIEFAERWDPQPFHVDPEFARTTRFGGLIGSGLHTLAIFQRLAVLGAYQHWAVIAGRSIRDISLTSPLRPDTTVRASVVINSVIPDSAERSLVSKTGTVVHGDLVLLTLQVESYVLRRT